MSALILALISGAVVGLALGALGGGGSVLAVPALVYLLGFTPAAATTAALLIVTATSLTALYTHARAGNVRWRAGALFAAAGLLPAAAAGAAASRLPQPVLTTAFALVAALAAGAMLRPDRTGAAAGAAAGTVAEAAAEATEAAGDEEAGVATEAAGGAVAEAVSGTVTGAVAGTATGTVDGAAGREAAEVGDRPVVREAGSVKVAGAGAGLGALTGLLGVGGGFLAVPALVTVVAFETRAAVGTSLLVISANSLASLAARGNTATTVDWAVVAPFAGAAILGAWDGRRLAAKVTGPLLRRLFAVTLLAVAAFMLLDAVI
ncbi:sulfite exporter TauE/SafE family protein [Streptomyces sp. NPDC093085]|uniref:sulfite exporter TauE/SafE family protein n=1 Tax=Streptomyces sp. NPDC093085 TaxID=3155068 RepID=UPI003443EC4D